MVHQATVACPVCELIDPKKLIEALHAVASSPAPFRAVMAAIAAIKPFTAQLGGREIMAFGHTVADVIALGKAQAGLEAWANGAGAQCAPTCDSRSAEQGQCSCGYIDAWLKADRG